LEKKNLDLSQQSKQDEKDSEAKAEGTTPTAKAEAGQSGSNGLPEVIQGIDSEKIAKAKKTEEARQKAIRQAPPAGTCRKATRRLAKAQRPKAMPLRKMIYGAL